MKSIMKKVFVSLLALTMIVGIIGVQKVSAEEPEQGTERVKLRVMSVWADDYNYFWNCQINIKTSEVDSGFDPSVLVGDKRIDPAFDAKKMLIANGIDQPKFINGFEYIGICLYDEWAKQGYILPKDYVDTLSDYDYTIIVYAANSQINLDTSSEQPGDFDFTDGTLTIKNDKGVEEWTKDTAIDIDEIKSLVVAKEVTSITSSAFNACSNLQSISFEGAISINSAFIGITGLKKLVFPEGSSVYGNAFTNCTGLESVEFCGDIELSDGLFNNCTGLKVLEFKGTSYFGGGAFLGCYNIESIKFGGKTIIKGGSFSGTNEVLTELEFPAGSEVWNSAFQYYKALKKVSFLGDATVKGSAFMYCSALEEIVFVGNCSIADSSFGYCPNIASITFTQKATLMAGAFCNKIESPNTKLTELVLPFGSELKDGYNADSAFDYSTNLKKLTVKDGATVGSRILFGCTGLETITFEAETPQEFKSLTFTNFDPKTLKIYVPDVDAYKAEFAKDTGDDESVRYNSEYIDCLRKIENSDQPGQPDNPTQPGQPDNPTQPDQPGQPSQPSGGDDPVIIIPSGPSSGSSDVIGVGGGETPQGTPEGGKTEISDSADKDGQKTGAALLGEVTARKSKTIKLDSTKTSKMTINLQLPQTMAIVKSFKKKNLKKLDADVVPVKVKYKSSNKAVATVDSKTGKITPVGVGTTIITATITTPDGTKTTVETVIKIK